MEATDCAIDGTVIWASRAEGLVARAGAPAWTTGIGRGASGRTPAGAWGAGLDLETALAAGAALVFAAADLAGAVGVLTGNGFFAAGFFAAVFTALAAGLADFAAGFAVFLGGTLAVGLAIALVAGLALAAGFTGALAVFFAGAGLALAAALAVLAAALGWGFKSCLLATALALA